MTDDDLGTIAEPYSQHWSLLQDVTYLNHGSFGPSPKVVQSARQEWSQLLEREPMDFFVRQMEGLLEQAADRLGRFIGAAGDNLIFVDNATAAMNIVAASIELKPNDQVLFTDHEYGAVLRLWRRVCRQAGAEIVVQPLPDPLVSEDEIVETLMGGVTDHTRLIVTSHITSPTAVILPVEKICRAARDQGVPVCVDGPHAVAMIPLDLKSIGCDYYTASCHKWLSAPFGSGFLYVADRRKQSIQPAVVSWGGSLGGLPADWKDEFNWIGTRDPAGYLAVPAAIEFLESVGLNHFRASTHELARDARLRIAALTGLEPLVPDESRWYGSMVTLPLPEEQSADKQKSRIPLQDPLQAKLWEQHRIEVPIMHWKGRRLIRVSCHLYNTTADIDRLCAALEDFLPPAMKDN